MRALFLAVALLAALPCEAAPKWLKRTVEYAVYAAPVVTSVLATHYAHGCRERNGVAPCAGGYGDFALREAAVRGGLSITFTGLSMYGHRAGFKEWFAPAVGMAAFNSYVAYHEAHVRVAVRDRD